MTTRAHLSLLLSYERARPGGSPGNAILSAVKWAYDGGAAFDEAFEHDGDARAHYRGIVTVLQSFRLRAPHRDRARVGAARRRTRPARDGAQKGVEPSQSHAWVEFHAPSAGWVAFDPTHGRPVDERYVVVGHGRHYDDVPPNKGIYRGPAHETLTAEVYTRSVASTAIPRAADDVRTIELRTFATAPTRRSATTLPPAAEEQAEQQQQQ